ncbi:hypothetical protein BDZ91DRAFT_711963, partial [Kalaharituber pfeilii]
MGLPMYRKPEEPRDPESASSRRSIRRRLHRHIAPSHPLRRGGIERDRDRRSSQQVLLDLLNFTQDNASSSSATSSSTSSGMSGASSAVTTVSSMTTGRTVPTAPQPPSSTYPYYLRRDLSSLPPIDGPEDYDPFARLLYNSSGPVSPYPMPALLSSQAGVRVIRHAPASEPPFLLSRDRERDGEHEGERNRDRGPSRGHTRDRDESGAGTGTASNKLLHPSILREEGPPSSSERETSRLPDVWGMRFSPTTPAQRSELWDTINEVREQIRELTSVPDVSGTGSSGRRRGSAVNGLGDRERSLSPDVSHWPSYLPSLESYTTTQNSLDSHPHPHLHPLDISLHCDFLVESDYEDSDDDEGRHPADGPSTAPLRWGELPNSTTPETERERRRERERERERYPSPAWRMLSELGALTRYREELGLLG